MFFGRMGKSRDGTSGVGNAIKSHQHREPDPGEPPLGAYPAAEPAMQPGEPVSNVLSTFFFINPVWCKNRFLVGLK